MGGDALRLPGTLTDTCALGRACHILRLRSLTGCSTHTTGPGSSLEGLGWQLRRGGCTAGSVNPTAQALEPRPWGDTAQDLISPWEPEGIPTHLGSCSNSLPVPFHPGRLVKLLLLWDGAFLSWGHSPLP